MKNCFLSHQQELLSVKNEHPVCSVQTCFDEALRDRRRKRLTEKLRLGINRGSGAFPNAEKRV